MGETTDRADCLRAIVERLTAVRDAIPSAGLEYSFMSETMHLLATAKYNLREAEAAKASERKGI